MARFYAYQGCDTCRRAKRWLAEQGVTFQETPVREQPPAAAELRQALEAQGGAVRKLFNVSGRDYKAFGIKDKLPQWSTEEAIEALTRNGNLVKRPFLATELGAWAGFDEAAWRRLLVKG